MRDPDLERRLDEGLAELLDRTDRAVRAPDVEHIHRRAETRTLRGIAVTLAATTGVGLLLGAVVLGVGGIGMRDDPLAGRPLTRPEPARSASPSPTGPTPAPAAGSGVGGTVAPSPTRRVPTAPVSTTAAVPSLDPAPSGRPSATGGPAPEPTRPAPRTPTGSQPAVQPSAPSSTAAAPRPSTPAPGPQRGSTPPARPPLPLRLAFRADARDGDGCRRTWRIDRVVQVPTPRSVVRAVLDGPTGAERGRGVGSVYGRGGRTTPAAVVVDQQRRQVTVHLASLSSVAVSPAGCRGREIRGPVRDALRQLDPRWSVRFTVRGDGDAFARYADGT